MKIALIIAINDHPCLIRCLKNTSLFCDFIIIRIDKNSKYYKDQTELLSIIGKKEYKIVLSKADWGIYNWREELITALHSSGYNPDIVVATDQDEEFDVGVMNEILLFNKSSKKGMMFSYKAPMPTADGRIPIGGKPYPPMPHMKVFKYEKGITYLPYQGYARIKQYSVNKRLLWYAKTKIIHYSLWTKLLESQKTAWLKKTYNFKL